MPCLVGVRYIVVAMQYVDCKNTPTIQADVCTLKLRILVPIVLLYTDRAKSPYSLITPISFSFKLYFVQGSIRIVFGSKPISVYSY